MKPLLLCALLALASSVLAAPRPNILFLFSDDQRFDTIRALGNDEIRTPHLDRLVARGTAFTHAHIMGAGQGAVCVPSRAMLMTGRTLFRATTNLTGGVIATNTPTWPELFRAAGYDTIGIGKWHNDRPSFARAFSAGGPVFFGGMTDHDRIAVHDFDSSGRYAKTNERVALKDDTELFADAAIAALRARRAADKPFVLYVPFTSPHDPRTPPEEFAKLYPPEKMRLPKSFLPEHPFDNGELKVRDEKLLPWPRTPEAVRREIALYYGMISHLDAQIGRVLDALDASPSGTNTIIVFAGDNGLAVGRHGLLGKQSLYEHSLRVPLIVAGPGVPAGRKSAALCYLLDLFPTLCDLAGVKAPATVEGRSLAPVLRGETTKHRPELFAAYRDLQRMVRDGRWKLIHYPKIARWQLFDLETDPDELADLSAHPAQAARLAAMKERLAAMQRELGDPLARR